MHRGWLELLTRRTRRTLPFKKAMPFSPEELRAYRAKKKYGQNELGMFVRKQAFRKCDYTEEGHLNQFASEKAAADFEEKRYINGNHQARYSTRAKDTVPSSRNLFG